MTRLHATYLKLTHLKRAAKGMAGMWSTFSAASSSPCQGRSAGPDQVAVAAVLSRDRYRCVVAGCDLTGVRGIDWSIHHRKPHRQGGDNRLSNLITVCGHGAAGCHGDLHAAPRQARDGGWIVSRAADPARVQIAHASHGHVHLDDDGDIQRSVA